MRKKKELKSIMEKLLGEKPSQAENEILNELGLKTKGATKQTVLAAALYKKAATGDLSAIKEIRSIISASAVSDDKCRVVMIVDDTV
ncbi:MAG: hypothetical protein KBS52_03815 [Clostridiales bacterium]|nr:hypothetical protein [Candidatus Equinaster intestinalis]